MEITSCSASANGRISSDSVPLCPVAARLHEPWAQLVAAAGAFSWLDEGCPGKCFLSPAAAGPQVLCCTLMCFQKSLWAGLCPFYLLFAVFRVHLMTGSHRTRFYNALDYLHLWIPPRSKCCHLWLLHLSCTQFVPVPLCKGLWMILEYFDCNCSVPRASLLVVKHDRSINVLSFPLRSVLHFLLLCSDWLQCSSVFLHP